jgi:hypothetical protein
VDVGRCPRCDAELTLVLVLLDTDGDMVDPDVHDRAAWSDAVVAAELREATHREGPPRRAAPEGGLVSGWDP